MQVILLGDLNVRMRKRQDVREDEIAMLLADSRLVNVKSHFMPRQRY